MDLALKGGKGWRVEGTPVATPAGVVAGEGEGGDFAPAAGVRGGGRPTPMEGGLGGGVGVGAGVRGGGKPRWPRARGAGDLALISAGVGGFEISIGVSDFDVSDSNGTHNKHM